MRTVSNIFETKATRILRCLLVNVGEEWTVREVAREAGTSVGYTHAVLAALVNMKYVGRNERNKLLLLDAETLLKRWAAYHQYTFANRFLQYYTFEAEVDSFLRRFGERLEAEEYALTSLSGAWLISSYVRPVDVHFYVGEKQQVERIAGLLDIKPTAGTGNVKIVIPYDSGVFYGARLIDGVKVVSNVQLFVDLWNYSSRGEDAARRVYEVMEKDWSKILAGASNV
jgi:AraC-like DNA-binding protein